jgi:hypothetical protein
MANTLTICSYSLLALGLAVAAWLYPHPLMFAPYLILPFAIHTARRLIVRWLVLAYSLILVSVGFWFCWDVTFVHVSTLNLMPLNVAMVEAVVTGAICFVVRRVDAH